MQTFMMIKKNRTHGVIALLLLLALSFNSFTSASAQQQPQRERRVSAPVPQPVQTPTPKPTPTPTPQPFGSPISVGVSRSSNAPQTLDELRARIQEVLRNPELASAQMAIKVASLNTGRTLYEENAEKLLHPASNMKIYTVAAALDRLSPDFRFKTSAYTQSMPERFAATSSSTVAAIRRLRRASTTVITTRRLMISRRASQTQASNA
jgi:D-alanyl-D-alanine carboxypeptidase